APLCAMTPGCDQTACRTDHDTIPRFDLPPTITSLRNGSWSDPTTWDQNRLPIAADKVAIHHAILYDAPDGQSAVIGISTTSGILIFDTIHPTKLTVDTIFVLPGSKLLRQPGTAPTEIVFRDTPLDTTFDPSQYGHGLLAFDATIILT